MRDSSPPPGHVMAASVAIGSMALVLALGLEMLGLAERLDRVVIGWLHPGGQQGFPKQLPAWVIWAGTGVVAYGLAFAMLSVPGTWRRVVLWVTCLVVVAGWVPVLALAAIQPAMSAPAVAVLWCGLCSLVYSQRHRMNADEELPTTDGAR